MAVLFYLFVSKIVSSHTLCILLYSAPLSLRATDVANGNANGGRNNALSTTVSRPMPHSTSPSPSCVAGDQGKENLSDFLFQAALDVEFEIYDFVVLLIVAVPAIQSFQIHLLFGMTINDNAGLFNTGNNIFHITVWFYVNLGMSLWCSAM